MKRILIVTLIVSWVLLLVSSVFCQSENTQKKTVYSYQNIYKNHPDGVVGKISFGFGSSYLTVKDQYGQSIFDAQHYQAGIGWVIADNFYERQSFTIIKKIQTSYNLSFGFSYYLSNPVNTTAHINPDGKTGSPILLFDAFLLLDNFKETKSLTNLRAKILFPFSPAFSIFGGYTAYEKISSNDVEKIFGGLHIFLSSYSPHNKYANPDAPVSGMAISLSGGSSEFGGFGQIDLAVPSSESVTVNIALRTDFLDNPNNKIYTGSFQIRYYTGK